MQSKFLYTIIFILLGVIIYQRYNLKTKIKFSLNNKNYSLNPNQINELFNLQEYQDNIQSEVNVVDSHTKKLVQSDLIQHNIGNNISILFNISSPGRNIDILEARELISNYQGSIDTTKERSVYFSLEHIIKKIDSLKNTVPYFVSRNATYDNFGIRVYFGKYGAQCLPFNCNDQDLGSQCELRNTVFLELTYDSILTDNVPGNANYNRLGDGRNITDLSDTFKLNIKHTLRNVGGLCPPNCPNGYLKHDKVLFPQ